MTSQWTSLEVVKLVIAALTPLTVVGLGVLIAARTRRVEDVRWANQLIVERRVELFGLTAPKLNKILCFGTFVGRWKELTPEAVLELKRELDEIMHTNRLMFSPEVFVAYHDLMSTCFRTFANVNKDALIRLPVRSAWGDRQSLAWWSEDMSGSFTSEEDRVTTQQAGDAYDALQRAFRADLYVTTTSTHLH